MKISSTYILESKLKRHKISYSNENGKIIIGKAKTDYTTLIGLVALPILAAIGIILLMVWDKTLLSGTDQRKLITLSVFLFLGGLFIFSRIITKKTANRSLKYLEAKSIKIKNEFGEHSFDSGNINDFEYSVDQIQEKIYEGNLYLIDNKNRKHQLWGFDDENSKYVLNDLKWFADYLIKHTELEIDEPKNEGAITLGFSSEGSRLSNSRL